MAIKESVDESPPCQSLVQKHALRISETRAWPVVTRYVCVAVALCLACRFCLPIGFAHALHSYYVVYVNLFLCVAFATLTILRQCTSKYAQSPARRAHFFFFFNSFFFLFKNSIFHFPFLIWLSTIFSRPAANNKYACIHSFSLRSFDLGFICE